MCISVLTLTLLSLQTALPVLSHHSSVERAKYHAYLTA